MHPVYNARRLFVIYDEAHAERCGEFSSLTNALERLRYLAALPWNQNPNLAPCTGWRTCGRRYELVEYAVVTGPWIELKRVPALQVSAKGVVWNEDFDTAVASWVDTNETAPEAIWSG